MKFLFTILILIPFFCKATNYTYSTGSGSNILIDSNTFGTNLKAGDTVFIPPYPSSGWRSHYYEHLRGGTAYPGIVIFWEVGAYINPNLGSQIQANGLEDCIGVKITGVNPSMNDNEDLFFRFNTGTYSSWIWIDHWHFNYQQGLIQVASTLPNMAGDSTKMFHHWKITNCAWDTSVNEQGGTAILMGSIAANGYWRDVEMANDSFANYYSVGGVPSTYVELENVYNINAHDCYIDTLGVVAAPTGHAASFVCECVKGNFYNLHFGSYNYGNDIRFLGTGDLPIFGSNYIGLTTVYNCITQHKRKYPFVEWRDIGSTDSSTLAPYVRPRREIIVTNNTCYSLNTDTVYLTAILDCYANPVEYDTPYVHNNVFAVMPDYTWGSSNGPFVISNTTSGLIAPDSANNFLFQFYSSAGFQDSIRYVPTKTGPLYRAGTAAMPYPSSDIYGVPRPISGPVDIGAVMLILGIGPIPYGSKINVLP